MKYCSIPRNGLVKFDIFICSKREGNEYKLPSLHSHARCKYIAFLIHTAVRSVILKNYRAETTSYFTIFPPPLHEGFHGSIQAIKNILFVSTISPSIAVLTEAPSTSKEKLNECLHRQQKQRVVVE